MATFLIALGAGLAFLIAYHTYGRWIAARIFRLDPEAAVPSQTEADDADYVSTPRSVVFGHHFTSIAGTGPIVGPAIAVLWGWVPALLWVLFGSIFIGAVHDFAALVVSLRNRGLSVGDISGSLINRRVRLLFLLILFMALTVVLAIFGIVIGSVFRMYPAAITPCVVQIPIALVIGVLLHRRGVGLLLPSIIALAVMYASVVMGDWGPLHTLNTTLAALPLFAWVVILLIYSYIASVLPVWTLLQPRDYINSLQLITAMALLVIGLGAAAILGGSAIETTAGQTVRPPLELVAPAFDLNPQAAPIFFPFLFITIACGAISGFHCLVSSGTSSKQLACETDARFVAFGGMLTEGFLATMVILACAAGLGLGSMAGGELLVGAEAWAARYQSWGAVSSLGAKIGAFVDGSANFLKALGLPAATATALMGVLVASFAGTTLDTACRLQRYIVQELASVLERSITRPALADVPRRSGPLTWLQNRHGATLFAVAIATAMATIPRPGVPWSWDTAATGGLILWPLFGATNQLLGGLAFLVIAFYLWRRRKPIWFLIVPMLFMLIMPAWAMVWQIFVEAVGSDSSWLEQGNWVLVTIGLAALALEAWMVIEAIVLFPRARGVLERAAPIMPARAQRIAAAHADD